MNEPEPEPSSDGSVAGHLKPSNILKASKIKMIAVLGFRFGLRLKSEQ